MSDEQSELNFNAPERVNILGTEILRVEYRGLSVVTLRQVDELHGRPENAAFKQFDRHKERYVEGVDFFDLDSIGTSEFRNSLPGGMVPQNARKLKLFTERGYGKIVRGWNDDRAWALHDAMQDVYFAVQQMLSAEELAIKQLAADHDHHDKLTAKLGREAARGPYVAQNRLQRYLEEMRHANKRQAEIIHADNKKIEAIQAQVYGDLKMLAQQVAAVVHQVKQAEGAINLDHYCTVNSVYSLAEVTVKIPRRGTLSKRVSDSLDSYYKAVRGPDGKPRYDAQEVNLDGRPRKVWHRDLVDAWLKEKGRAMIWAHIRQHGESSNVVHIGR